MKRKCLTVGITLIFLGICITTAHSELQERLPESISGPEKFTNENWTEFQRLVPSDGEDWRSFGWSIYLDGDTALIGAYADDDNGVNSGSAYVFTRTGDTWTQQQKLLPSDGMAGDQFGFSVSLHENTALIGTPADNDNGNFSGSAYVFVRTGTTWTQQAKLLASDGEMVDRFGWCVSLYDNSAIIGAPADDDNGSWTGSAYVFTRTGNSWTQQAKLLASDSNEYDNFGTAVFIKDDTALIGTPFDDDNGPDSGSAYVFTHTRTNWTQQAKLLPTGNMTNDWFGISLSLDGDTALIGATEYQSGGCGAAYMFSRNGTHWFQQQTLNASDGAPEDWFGKSVSLSGDTILIGSPHDEDVGYLSGSAYVFTHTGNNWTQQTKLLASDGAEYNAFGCSVCVEGDTALIGTGKHDSAYIFIKEIQPPVANFTWMPTNPLTGQIITFNASESDDPDGSIVLYEWDWDTDGFYDEEHAVSTTAHLWGTSGVYPVTLRVTDDDGATGITTKTVTISNIPIELEFTINGGFGVSVDIINNGSTIVDDVPWEITVTGGILGLIHTQVTGTVDIPSGTTRTVGTGLLFGVGPISIMVIVADEKQTATGTQFFIISIIKN